MEWAVVANNLLTKYTVQAKEGRVASQEKGLGAATSQEVWVRVRGRGM